MEQAPSAQQNPLEQYEKRLRAARWLAKQGFGIVLLPTPTPGDCGCPPSSTTRVDGVCKSPGKHPLGKDWEHHAAHSKDEIDALTSAKPHLRALRQFGIFPEPGSDRIIIDEDQPGALRALCDEYKVALPDTFRVQTSLDPTTGERKRHFYGRAPEGYDMSRVPKTWIGGEVRVSGSGQVVGPWSRHASGVTYEPEGPAEIAVFPADLIEALRKTVGERSKAQTLAEKTGDEGFVLFKGDGRHEFLLQTARHLWKGGIRGEALVAQLVEIDQKRCNPPYGRHEMERLADWCGKNLDEPWVPIKINIPGAEDPASQQPALRIVRKDEFEYEVEPPKVGLFPEEPAKEAFTGSTGAALMVGELMQMTTASEVGLLATFLTFWSGVYGSHFHLYEDQPTNLFSVLVGDTASGRKGTTTRATWNAMHEALNPPSTALMQVAKPSRRWDGIASGQGIISHLSNAPEKHGVFVEEEFENVIRGARSSSNYTSTLGTTLQKAFDGSMLQHITVRSAITVDHGYTASILGNITREVLRVVMPPEFASGGFGNRFLWVPVQERDVATTRGGKLTQHTAQYLRDCKSFSEAHPAMGLTRPAEDLVNDYYRHLRSLTGLQSQMTRRLHVIAARIAVVHAMLDQQEEADQDHVLAGIALAEYSRRGMMWAFTNKTGDEWLDLVVSNLRAAGEEGLPTRAVARLVQNLPTRIERVKDLGTAAGLIEICSSDVRGRGRPSMIWKCAQNDPSGDFVLYARERTRTATPKASTSLGDNTDQSSEIEQNTNNTLTNTEHPSNNPRTSHPLKCFYYREHQSIHSRAACGAFHCSTCSPAEDGCPDPEPEGPEQGSLDL